MADSDIVQVREKYDGVARSDLSNEQPEIRTVPEAFGQPPEELADLVVGMMQTITRPASRSLQANPGP